MPFYYAFRTMWFYCGLLCSSDKALTVIELLFVFVNVDSFAFDDLVLTFLTLALNKVEIGILRLAFFPSHVAVKGDRLLSILDLCGKG